MNTLGALMELAVVVPVALAAVAGYAVGRTRPARVAGSLERELMRRRRREEPAALLVVEGRCPASAGPALAECLRVTDTVEARIRRGRVRMRVILDEPGLDRAAVERRLAATPGVALSAGWAAFPRDGLTVRVLADAARSRLAAVQPPPAEARHGLAPAAPSAVEQVAS